MKIEKTKTPIYLVGVGGDDLKTIPSTNEILGIEFCRITDNRISLVDRQHERGADLVLELRDALPIMKWAIGQIQHQDEQQRHDKKMTPIRDFPIIDTSISDPPNHEENQKIIDNLRKLVKGDPRAEPYLKKKAWEQDGESVRVIIEDMLKIRD